MLNEIFKFLILSFFFYIAALAHKKMTAPKPKNVEELIKQKEAEEDRTVWDFIKGYLLYVAISVWLYILFVANQHFISSE